MTSRWESIQKANLTCHKVAPFSLWLKPSNSCSQVIRFSGDYRNLPFSASNTRKISFVWLSLSAAWLLFIAFACLIPSLHMMMVSLPISFHRTSQVSLLLFINSAHPYYPLRTENFPEPLTLPFPTCAPADLPSSLSLIFLLTTAPPHSTKRPSLWHSPNLAKSFCTKSECWENMKTKA